jgi:hypothetical protein
VVQRKLAVDVVDQAGDYEREYSCYPPTVCMIIISVIEVILLKLLLEISNKALTNSVGQSHS